MLKTKPLHLTHDEIAELLNIVEVCQSHIQDYDLDDTDDDGEPCPYKETDEDCTKWVSRLTKLEKKKFK